jgi:cytochrome P450
MKAFADHYPARVLCDLLHIPYDDYPRFLRWADDLALSLGLAVALERERIEEALAGFYVYVDGLLAQRRRDPGDDLISALIAVQGSAEPFGEEDLRAVVSGLMFAGHHTTRNQLGLAMFAFCEHPDQWALLAEQPELAATAVEEVLRVRPTTPSIRRVATEDLTYRGLSIPAGTLLFLFVATANNEPDTFGSAPFDITARRPAALTFGGGAHHCLGSNLARMELREALPILAARLPEPKLTGAVTWRPSLGITGPLSLPVTFG